MNWLRDHWTILVWALALIAVTILTVAVADRFDAALNMTPGGIMR